MRELKFTPEQLKEAVKGNYVAAGSEASIYKYKKFIALRLYDIEENIFNPVLGYTTNHSLCEKMIKNLHVYKNNVKLSSFPIGVVKVNDIVVGQVIKYYKNSVSLIDFFKSSPSVEPIPYYLKVLDILEELALNNICYDDVHGGNFLVVGSKLKIIDFSEYRVKVDEHYKGMYYYMFQNFSGMVNRLNFEVLNGEDKYEKLIIPAEIKEDHEHIKENFDYVRELVKNLEKKKVKKK